MAGTAGRLRSAVWLVRTSGPRVLQKRSVVTEALALRAANSWTASSGPTMPGSSRVRGAGGAGWGGEPCPRRVRAAHVLGEEARVVAFAAVVVRRGLEHDLPHRRV